MVGLGGGRLLHTVAQGDDLSVGGILVGRTHGHPANRCLELDERVGMVVAIIGRGLAFSAEVGVVADSTLVASSTDIAGGNLALAQRSIAENTIVDLLAQNRFGNRAINRNKPMASVACRCTLQAVRTVIPVGARQAFVTDANDTLFH